MHDRSGSGHDDRHGHHGSRTLAVNGSNTSLSPPVAHGTSLLMRLTSPVAVPHELPFTDDTPQKRSANLVPNLPRVPFLDG